MVAFNDYALERLKPCNPWDPELLNGATVDLRLAESVHLAPGDFLLSHTIEVVTIPLDALGIVAGKSSPAREGLQVECAGVVDPGFSGQLVLELKNLGHEHLYPEEGQRIAQLWLMELSGPTTRPYAVVGHYMHQRGNRKAWWHNEQ